MAVLISLRLSLLQRPVSVNLAYQKSFFFTWLNQERAAIHIATYTVGFENVSIAFSSR